MVKIAAYLSVIALLVGCGGDSKQGSDVEISGVSKSEIRIGTHTDLSGPVAIWGVGVTMVLVYVFPKSIRQAVCTIVKYDLL